MIAALASLSLVLMPKVGGPRAGGDKGATGGSPWVPVAAEAGELVPPATCGPRHMPVILPLLPAFQEQVEVEEERERCRRRLAASTRWQGDNNESATPLLPSFVPARVCVPLLTSGGVTPSSPPVLRETGRGGGGARRFARGGQRRRLPPDFPVSHDLLHQTTTTSTSWWRLCDVVAARLLRLLLFSTSGPQRTSATTTAHEPPTPGSSNDTTTRSRADDADVEWYGVLPGTAACPFAIRHHFDSVMSHDILDRSNLQTTFTATAEQSCQRIGGGGGGVSLSLFEPRGPFYGSVLKSEALFHADREHLRLKVSSAAVSTEAVWPMLLKQQRHSISVGRSSSRRFRVECFIIDVAALIRIESQRGKRRNGRRQEEVDEGDHDSTQLRLELLNTTLRDALTRIVMAIEPSTPSSLPPPHPAAKDDGAVTEERQQHHVVRGGTMVVLDQTLCQGRERRSDAGHDDPRHLSRGDDAGRKEIVDSLSREAFRVGASQRDRRERTVAAAWYRFQASATSSAVTLVWASPSHTAPPAASSPHSFGDLVPLTDEAALSKAVDAFIHADCE